jgi:hypothetical protein
MPGKSAQVLESRELHTSEECASLCFEWMTDCLFTVGSRAENVKVVVQVVLTLR